MKRRVSSGGVNSNDYVIVNFKGVSSRDKIVPEGSYRAIVMKVTKGTAKSGYPKLDWIFEVSEGPEEGHRFRPYVTSLQVQSLWNLRAVLEALGVEVPDEDLQIVFGELKGLELGLAIEHETYEHRLKERIIDLFPLEELDEGEPIEEGEEVDEKVVEKVVAGEMPKDRLITDKEAVAIRDREEAVALSKEAKELSKASGITIETEREEEEEEEEEGE